MDAAPGDQLQDSVGSDRPIPALASGEAELCLVLRLSREDVATLGAEASRLATQAAADPRQALAPAQAKDSTSPSAGRSPPERAQRVIDEVDGRAAGLGVATARGRHGAPEGRRRALRVRDRSTERDRPGEATSGFSF